MKRITVDGRQLADFCNGQPAQWVKVFPPGHASVHSIGRAYTIRRFDTTSREVDIDFALHGNSGPVSAFAMRAGPGDTFELGLPHPRSGFCIDVATKHYVLVGDETGLPAIGAILEKLLPDAKARVLIEVTGAADELALHSAGSLNVSWIIRNADTRSSALVDAFAREVVRPQSSTHVWVAAESTVVGFIRKRMTDLWHPRERLHAVGYWKRGHTAYRDREDQPR